MAMACSVCSTIGACGATRGILRVFAGITKVVVGEREDGDGAESFGAFGD